MDDGEKQQQQDFRFEAREVELQGGSEQHQQDVQVDVGRCEKSSRKEEVGGVRIEPVSSVRALSPLPDGVQFRKGLAGLTRVLVRIPILLLEHGQARPQQRLRLLEAGSGGEAAAEPGACSGRPRSFWSEVINVEAQGLAKRSLCLREAAL